MIGYRHCDARFPFLWSSANQPAARWHGANQGPVNYFADTPVGAWAEFLRHEGIRDAKDLEGVQRALWAVELPDGGYATPSLPAHVLRGNISTYAACQSEARRLRALGNDKLESTSAALIGGGARGWVSNPHINPAPTARDGKVWVLFGARSDLVAWPLVESGAPPERILPLIHHL
jgi:hypothetical protein